MFISNRLCEYSYILLPVIFLYALLDIMSFKTLSVGVNFEINRGHESPTSLIDNSTRSGLSIRKCPKRGLTLLRAGPDTWLISPRTYPKNSNLMDKMSCSKTQRDKKVSEATNDPMRPSRTPYKKVGSQEPLRRTYELRTFVLLYLLYVCNLVSMRFNFAGTPTYSLAYRDPILKIVSFVRRTPLLAYVD